jgi:hypothetical protein
MLAMKSKPAAITVMRMTAILVTPDGEMMVRFTVAAESTAPASLWRLLPLKRA